MTTMATPSQPPANDSGPEAPRQVIAPPPEFPPVPRAATLQASKVATLEPRVRFWLILAGVFAVTSLYFVVTRLSEWAGDRALVLSGTPTEAVIIWANGSDIRGSRKPWDSPVKLQFDAGGREIQVTGTLLDKPAEGLITIGEKVKIRHDSDNPYRWTDRKTPPGFAHSLIAVYLMLLMTVLTGLAAWWQRKRMLVTWRDGRLVAAAVTSVSSSPIAPGYAKVTARPTGSENNVDVFVPRDVSHVVRGDVIWLMTAPGGLPVAARTFV
jgi:hypothetical protein